MTEHETEPAVDPDAEPLEELELEPDDEAEPGDQDEPDELEAAGDEPDAGPSTQALLALLERERTRHEKAIAKALGVEPAEMHECPTCEGIGYTPEPIEAPPALVQDPFTETCARCAGNGKTKSGASPLGLYEIPCNGCGGSGYVTKPEQPAVGAQYGNEAPPPPAYAPPAIASPQDEATVAALRAQGYTILEPITVPAPVPV